MGLKIYSRKRLARVVASLCFIVFGYMLIAFLPSFWRDMNVASGSSIVFVISEGILLLGSMFLYLYYAFRTLRPKIVEGSLVKTNGNFVNRERSDLVVQLGGKRYKLPLDSGVDTKLNSILAEDIELRMEIGAFGSAISLEINSSSAQLV